MKEIGYQMEGKLNICGVTNNKPNILRRGGPIPSEACPMISLATNGHSRSTFRCASCNQPVLTFSGPNATIVQACRCMLVAHLCPDQVPPYTTLADWSDFQVLYETERQDPVLPIYLRTDPFDGTVLGFSPRGMRWLCRKFQLPDDVDVDVGPDGAVLSVQGGGSLHIDPQSGSMSALAAEAQEKLVETILEIHAKKDAGPGPMALHTLIIGNDSTYIWPSQADTTKVQSAPFRCPRCKARVKSAPIPGYLEVDRVYGCLCMVAILRREAPTPRSSGDWGELRVKADTQTVRHKATIADACS